MMQWPRNARLSVRDSRLLSALPLSPEDFFVLSRIEGTPTVAELLKVCGLPQEQACEILDRLVKLGAVEVVPVAPSSASAVAERRRKSLVLQLEGARSKSPPNEATHDRGTHTNRNGTDDAPGNGTGDPGVDEAPAVRTWPEVAADDRRLLGSIPIPVAEQRRILALVDGLDALSPFEILGLAPTHDAKAIRRAYHEVSRELHPDAYFGQDVGPFRGHLAVLFARAKLAQEALRDPAIRTPYVDAEIRKVAELRRRQQQRGEQLRAEEAQRRAEEAAEATKRQEERAALRAQRERERVLEAAKRQATSYIAEATEAQERGNLAAAANLLRLALQLQPQDAALRAQWERCRDEARKRRGVEAFTRAQSLRDIGHHPEATALFIEAAEAHPSLEHLVWGAEAAGAQDPARARKFALAALDALKAEALDGTSARRGPELAHLHLMLAKAFSAAGQVHTAREQLVVADKHRPGDPEVRALLNSLKLP